MASVMLFSPVRVDVPTLSLALQSHRALHGVKERVYVDDCDDTVASTTLHQEQQYDSVTVSLASLPPDTEQYRDENTHTWSHARISRVATLRNNAIRSFLASDHTHLFITDIDLVLNDSLVQHLVGLDLPVVSEVFWTKWQTDGAYAPNVWDIHPYGHTDPKNVLQLMNAGTYEVGGLGACTLIKREVLEKGIDYSPIPSFDCEGEDRHFCVKCSAHGLKLMADTHYPPYHVYRASQLDEARMWFDQGRDREYFNEVWLSDLEETVKAAVKQATPGARKSIALCIPGETFSAAWVMGLVKTLPALNREHDMQVVNVFSSNPSVTRQTIVRTLLSNSRTFDYVLWLDDDNVISEEHVKLLLEVMDTYPDIDLVAGWCDITRGQYDHGDNTVSCGLLNKEGRCDHFAHEEIGNAHGLVSIDWTGFPCVMMRGSLIQRLGPKSFSNISDDSLEWGFFGEDVSFCKRAREIGAVMVMDPRIKVPHLKLRDANNPVLAPEATKEKA